jgi:hypothetical protein
MGVFISPAKKGFFSRVVGGRSVCVVPLEDGQQPETAVIILLEVVQGEVGSVLVDDGWASFFPL